MQTDNNRVSLIFGTSNTSLVVQFGLSLAGVRLHVNCGSRWKCMSRATLHRTVSLESCGTRPAWSAVPAPRLTPIRSLRAGINRCFQSEAALDAAAGSNDNEGRHLHRLPPTIIQWLIPF